MDLLKDVIEVLVNAFWVIALSWDLSVLWNKLHIMLKSQR